MNAIAYNYKCATCRTTFEAPEVPELSYGLFVLRSHTSFEAAFLDANYDSVFLESYELVKRHFLVKRLSPELQGKIQQAVFSVTCDKTAGGHLLKIGIPPKCPSCNSEKMEKWCSVMPARDWPLPNVEHQSWEVKSLSEREALIDTAIRRFLEDGTK